MTLTCRPARLCYDALGLLVEEAEPALASVLDLLSDDAAGLDSALPPSFDAPFGDASFGDATFAADSFAADSFVADSFDPDSELAAFFRASDG
jgi:hypothetical protein